MTNACSTEYKPCGGGPFFGRLLISLIFILGGIGKIIDFKGASDSLSSMGVSGSDIYISIGLLVELIGGILLLIGCYTRFAVYILMIFLFPTTFIFHSFWLYRGVEASMQLSTFLKNLAIFGGLFLILSYGPGNWSIDACRSKKRAQQP
ncbi:MAG: DoxX family protein [Chlamydiales bacterium]